MPELKLKLRGAIPANLMPFKNDLSIDEAQYRRHMRWLADVPGVGAIVCNGHAAEVASLTEDEQMRAITIARDEVGTKVKLVAGVFNDGTVHAVRLARNAKAAGADGVLVFPPSLFMWGANLRPEMAYRHFASIANEADIPIVVFQYPVANGWGYNTELLLKLAEIENVVAVKEWSQDIVTFERNLRALQSAPRPIAVLSSFSASLYATFALGADGTISGMGSVVADWQAQMFDAVQRGDMKAARALNDKHFVLGQAFYAPPFLDMHNRMKEALVMLGRLDLAVVRQPLEKIPPEDRERVRTALIKTGLLQADKARAV
ncbi:MAG: dihydrodipicolinate synthase family protein [Candidatus Korobacteraceae bacterium]|jgi:4-hydroxy-tetrahydrodipicolinate synthase